MEKDRNKGKEGKSRWTLRRNKKKKQAATSAAAVSKSCNCTIHQQNSVEETHLQCPEQPESSDGIASTFSTQRGTDYTQAVTLFDSKKAPLTPVDFRHDSTYCEEAQSSSFAHDHQSHITFSRSPEEADNSEHRMVGASLDFKEGSFQIAHSCYECYSHMDYEMKCVGEDQGGQTLLSDSRPAVFNSSGDHHSSAIFRSEQSGKYPKDHDMLLEAAELAHTASADKSQNDLNISMEIVDESHIPSGCQEEDCAWLEENQFKSDSTPVGSPHSSLSGSLSDLSCGYEVLRLEEDEESDSSRSEGADEDGSFDEESNDALSDDSRGEENEVAQENDDDRHLGNVHPPHPAENEVDDPDDPDDPPEPDGAAGAEYENQNDDDANGHFGFNDPMLNIICRMHENVTVREVLVLVLTLSVRHSLSYQCIIDLFKVVNTILGRKYFPMSKKKMRKLLARNNIGIEEHAYCNRCLRRINNFEQRPARFQCLCGYRIIKCRAPVFVKLSLRKQLKFFLEKQRCAELLQYREEREKKVPDNIEDLMDGSLYRSKQEAGQILADRNNFSYVADADGFSIAKSSNAEVWPIFIRPVEIHPLLRQKYIFLAGVWVDRKRPNMNFFLRPFVREANTISQEGILWSLNGEERRSRFIPIGFTADAMGRCALMNHNEPTGYHACSICDLRGVHIGGTPKYPMWPYAGADQPEPQPRTHESIIRDMIAANNARPRRTVNGFKGFSELANLDHLDLKQSWSTDDLHPIFVGVVKDYIKELLKEGNDCYIGPDQLSRLNRRLMAVKTPTCISRKPRKLQTYKKWKATEFRNFLFYQLPCLEGILPARYLQHLRRLANAAFLLSQDSISEEDLLLAEQQLHEFCVEYEDVFGAAKMKFNLHMLLHLVEIVRTLGNLWNHSTFNFESWNYRLKKFVTSSNGVTDQVVNRLLIAAFVSSVPFDDRISDRVKEQVDKILNASRLDNAPRVGDVFLLGKGQRRVATVEEQEILRAHRLECGDVVEYKRAYCRNIEVRSTKYTVPGRSDNTHVHTWEGWYAHVKSILVFQPNGNEEQVCGMICEMFDSYHHIPEVSYMVRIMPSDRPKDWVPFPDLRSLAVKVTIPGHFYLSRIHNHIDID